MRQDASSRPMKSYLDLVPISARVHRRQSRMTRLCIALAVFLVAAIFGMADMWLRCQRIQSVQTDGSWHLGYSGITEEQADLIAARPDVKTAAWYQVVNYGLDAHYTIDGTETVVCGFDEALLTIFPAAAITEGRFPQNESEAVVNKGMLTRLGLALGDTVTLTTPAGKSLSYSISGVTADTALSAEHDAFGLFVNAAAYRAGYPSGSQNGGMFYVEFKPGANIQSAIADTSAQFGLTEKQIGQNTRALAMIGQSRDPFMLLLYASAAVLALLVAIAGTLMIGSSLNSNVAQRTRFFGMLRCLGASRRQVIRFVRMEALNWCKTAIPLGAAGSVAVVWGLCALLKMLSPNLFAGMPALGVSWLGLGVGAGIGLVTVLLAARAPAKKAAGVSPLTAVSGNADDARPARRAAHVTGGRGIETVLGVHHAVGSPKNFLLMVSSFAFSIILFLAFSTAIDFMNHAITPLKPYTPDLSIYANDNTCTVPADLQMRLAQNSAVKRVFGRAFAYDLPATADGQPLTVTLVSYEQYQFAWGADTLQSGALQPAADGTGVLAFYGADSPVAAGSTVTLDAGQGARTLPVTGVLATSPFSATPGVTMLVCSEALFRELTGQSNYTILEVQFNGSVTDADVAAIRAAAGPSLAFSDKRISNREARGAYYAFSLFVYGFLAVIALISLFNIINSIAMSVSARMQQYGAMRAIGMSDRQLLRMVAAEACTYAAFGIGAGCAVGLPINRALFYNMVTSHWGDAWQVPGGALAVILLVMLLGVVLAIRGPARRIRGLSIVDTIAAE